MVIQPGDVGHGIVGIVKGVEVTPGPVQEGGCIHVAFLPWSVAA
ncbi:hypothetical protein SXCC_00907 [Gluconacetobacter sp. SXCC-1]|nr:hypothetical protein SXCC_00907 [Gluconacetobacter sp. SXCC-1]